MSWKSFACLAAVAAMSTPALAQPTFAVDGTTLQVVVDATGSVAVEVAITGNGDLTPVTSEPADPVFDTANPGDNPFTGTTTSGAFVDGSNVFISFGSSILAPGTYDLWDFTGTMTADVTGLIAQEGVSTTGLTATIEFPGGGILGDFNNDGTVDGQDFGVFVGEFNQGTTPPAAGVADFNNDGNIDGQDFGVFVGQFNMFNSSATAVPEPTSVMLLLGGFAGIAALRRR